MKILAHRGVWEARGEQNTLPAFESALRNGFGIETDIRDCDGNIVVSHDMPLSSDCLAFEQLLELFEDSRTDVPLALNIKSDGLQAPIRDVLLRYPHSKQAAFFFDMSVPDAVQYLKYGMPCFTRYSEYEQSPSFLGQAMGVWVDGFDSDFSDFDKAREFCRHGLKVAVVSPELHKRAHHQVWGKWQKEFSNIGSMMLCTDFPFEARHFFDA